MSEVLTSSEAARLLGVHRDTTRRAAASGLVPGARQEPRPGAINPPWVAPRESWEQWYSLQQTAGRPRQEREEGTAMILADRIELAERMCAERGYTVRMTVQPHHGQPRYSGPPRPYMADGRWALYAVHEETGRMVSLGDRSRPPTERRIARQLDRLDRLVAAARADDADLAAVPTSATEAWMQFLAGCGTDAPARSEEDLRDMIHRLGIAYRIEDARVQPDGADPWSWGAAWEAIYETGWAWDATVPDEAVVQEYERRRQG